MSTEPPKGLVDRIFYALFSTVPQGFLDRVFHGLLFTTAAGFVGFLALVIVHATIVEVPKEFYLAVSVLGGASFSLMLGLCGLQWLAGWWSARMQKGFAEGLLVPLAKGLAISVGVLILLAFALSLGEEYGLLRVHPVLYKWLGGLIVWAIITIFVMIMVFD